MDKIITFIKRHKNQVKWAFVGVLSLIVAYYSYQALVALVVLFFGGTATQASVEEKRRKKVKDLHDEFQQLDERVEVMREVENEKRTAAGKKAAKDVDDFIDGGWQ